MLICWLFHKNCRCLLLHKKKKSFLPPKRGQFVPTSFELVRSLKKFFDNSSRSVLDTITVVNASNRESGFLKNESFIYYCTYYLVSRLDISFKSKLFLNYFNAYYHILKNLFQDIITTFKDILALYTIFWKSCT